MKNFGKILVCLLLCVLTVGLVGCKERPDPFFQTSATAAVGNGGLAVESNGYLYFVNGYMSASKQESQNASYTVGSLKVAKLNNGQVVTNERNYLNDEYLRTISDKLCGFEATGLYVFGDYLYFTAPCQEKEKGGNWVKERVEFYRIKLNKTGKVERIYQSKVNWDKLSYEYYFDGSKVSLVVCEKADKTILYQIDATNGKYPVTTVCDNVNDENYYLGANNDYQNNNYNHGYVFYLVENSNNGYDYVLYNPLTGVKTSKGFTDTCTIQYVSDKYVYYTVDTDSWHELKTFAISDNSYASSLLTYAYSDDTTFAVSHDDYVFIVASDSIKLLANPALNTAERPLVTGESEIKILGYANGSVIYYNGSEIKAVSYTTTDSNSVVLASVESLAEVYTNVTAFEMNYFSVAGNSVYFYATVTNQDGETNTYLYNVDLSKKVQVVSSYEEKDIPEVEDEIIY